MEHFLKINQGVDVNPLLLALKRNPTLWNQHKLRKEADGTPHNAMDDIWVRYRKFEDYDPAAPEKFNGPHFPIWYPSYIALPQLRPIIFGMMNEVGGEHLGGILITRIPPGGKITPHADTGWHPKFYNTKLYVPLATNSKCWFRVQDERVVMEVGDVWWLDNTLEHEIVNEGKTERITLIVCIRTGG